MLKGGKTDARHVHAVLAAAVADPALLERLRGQAGRTGDDVAAFDLERIRLFTGLTVKVRQNDVRLNLPLTFKLLDNLKISIPLFAAYGKTAAALRKAGGTTRADKMNAMAAFIESWLHAGDPAHALVRDILHHERALLACRESPARQDADAAAQGAARRRALADWVPHPAPGLIRHEMSCDPFALEAALRSSAGDLSALQRGEFFYVYGRDDRGCVTAKQIDELGHVLIDLADGRSSLAQLTAMLREAGVALTRAQLCDAAQTLADNGLLVLSVPKSRQKGVRRARGPGR